jgi:hypothetical protein
VPDSGTIPASGAPVAHRDRAGFERGMEGKPMRIPTRTFMLALAALALMAVGAQATAAQSCAKAKVPAAGKAASCRLKAAGVFLASAGGAADIEKRDAGYAKCQEKMDDAYAKADTEYGTDCAVPGNATTIDDLTAVYSDEVVRLNQPPAQSCAKAKVPAAGKAASCRLKAAGVFLASAGGAADIEKRDAAYAKCQSKMGDAYAKADAKYGTDCAVPGNATTIDYLTAVYSDDVVRLTVCGDGYSSDGQSCTDIDECATDNGGCGSGANCTNTTGSRTCECLPGYSDVDWECLDIDECSLNTDDCHANATCTNITGKYTCACDAGYSGDGQICTAVATGALWTRTTTSGQVVHLSAIPSATVGSFIIYKSFAETTVASVEAESLTGSGTIVRHNNASGGKALRLTTTTPAITTITTLSNVTDLQLRARGRPCAGAPRVIILIDGKQLIVADVSLQKYQDYSAKVTLPAGRHDISAVFANPFSKSSCTRAVVLDVLKAFDNTPPPTDSLPPSVAITTPTNNAVVTGVINIGANVSDNVGVSRVDVLIDDGIVSTLTAGPYSYSWDTSSVTNGAHIIKFVAYDAANNSAAATVNVTVNRTTVGANLPISYNLSSLSGTQRFVATDGSDTTGTGSQSAPYATLAKAISVAVNGDSIVVRGGTYRQGNIAINKSVKIIAYPGEVPTFNGAQSPTTAWVTEGTTLAYQSYTPQPVTDGSGISFTTGQNLAAGAIGKYPDQAWKGNTQLQQVADKASVVPGKFWVDTTVGATRIYLSSTDAASGVEYSKLNIFGTVIGPNVTMEGFQITRFSNSAKDAGVLRFLKTASNSLMKNMALYDAAFITVTYGETSGLLNNSTMQNVTIANANWMGSSALYTDNFKMDGVKITNSNQFGEFTFSPQSGALKTSRTRFTKVINSDISQNNSHGLWFDQSNVDVDVANNQMIDNKGVAVFFEISDDLLLANNYIKSTGKAVGTVKLAGSSGLKLVNNTIVGGADPVGIYTDVRSKPGCADTEKPLCTNSYGSDRDAHRIRPATLDWMPRLDLMINNIVSYPTASGYCGALTTMWTTMCIGSTNGSAVAPIETILHKADTTRTDFYGKTIPQTQINSNVYANGTGYIISTSIGRYATIGAFSSAMAGNPVLISGLESIGLYGNSWVNSDGSPAVGLAAVHHQATAVPTNTNINQYVPAGTKHFGVTYK